MAELGVVGLTLYLSIIAISLTCLLRAAALARRVADRDLMALSYAVFLGVLSALVANFFISEQLAKLHGCCSPWGRRCSRSPGSA